VVGEGKIIGNILINFIITQYHLTVITVSTKDCGNHYCALLLFEGSLGFEGIGKCDVLACFRGGVFIVS